jgi:ferrous iron transport protein A
LENASAAESKEKRVDAIFHTGNHWKRIGVMASSKCITLTKMLSGHSGMVADIQGGFGFIARLNALGIMPGKRITKVSSMVGQGPITIELDRVQVAIGFGMANRIMVKVDQVG